MDGSENFSEMARDREEEEESGDSRMPRFGAADASSYFIFAQFLLFGCYIECILFNSSPFRLQPTDEGEGLCVIYVAVICVFWGHRFLGPPRRRW
jgi:hypothetical protein